MLSEYHIQLVKEYLDTYLPDKYLVRASLTLIVLIVLIPGVFQLSPPKWFGEAPLSDSPLVVEAPSSLIDEKVSAQDEMPLDGQMQEEILATKEAVPTATQRTDGLEEKQSQNAASAGDKPEDTDAALPYSVDQTELVQEEAVDEQPAVRARDVSPPKAREDKAAIASIITDSGKPPMIARMFVKTIPAGHENLDVARQKSQFIATVLPLILAANEEIIQRRMAIKRAVANNDRESLKRWARLYRLSGDDILLIDLENSLLRRANEIPVPIALAQAAVESGWGTSRFARQGNALFGQWAWDKSAGLRPLQASNSRAVVRSFPNLFGSVRAYMHNLNTHSRYQPFRQQREKIVGSSNAEKADQLVEYLDGYAETGYEYVTKLRAIMRSNQFTKYADAFLQ